MNKIQGIIADSFITGVMSVLGLLLVITGIDVFFQAKYISAIILIIFGCLIEYKSYQHITFYYGKYFKGKVKNG